MKLVGVKQEGDFEEAMAMKKFFLLVWRSRGAAIGGLGIFCSGVLGGLWEGDWGKWASWAAQVKAPVSERAKEADFPDMPGPGGKPVGGERSAEKLKAPSPEGTPAEKGLKAAPSKFKGQPTPEAVPKSAPMPQVPLPPEDVPEAKAPASEGKSPPTKPKAKLQAPEEAIQEWPVDESLRRNRPEVLKILRSGSWTPEQMKLVTQYYTQYALARWTHQANRAEVRRFRDELLRDLREAEGQAHDQLIKLVMDLLIKMAEGNHTPVARVNAVLALGELNRTEAPAGKLPVPLPEAQQVLLRWVQNPETPDILRISALVGIRRHVELNAVADPMKRQIATVLTTLAKEQGPSPGAAAGHLWLRTMAVEMLELLGTPGPNAQAVQTLMELMGDTSTPLSLRVAAARAVGNLTYPQDFPGDLQKLLREMGQVALDALQAELENYAKEKRLLARRLQTYLIGVYNGLIGLEKVASRSPAQQSHQNILGAVRGCVIVLENPQLRTAEGKIMEEAVVNELTKQKALLAEAIAGGPPPSAPPAEKKTP